MDPHSLLDKSDHRKGTKKGRETCPFRALDGFNEIRLSLLEGMAGTTGLEPAASAVTAVIETVTDWSRTAQTRLARTRGFSIVRKRYRTVIGQKTEKE